MTYHVGERVRLRTGRSPMRVVSVTPDSNSSKHGCRAIYESSYNSQYTMDNHSTGSFYLNDKLCLYFEDGELVMHPTLGQCDFIEVTKRLRCKVRSYKTGRMDTANVLGLTRAPTPTQTLLNFAHEAWNNKEEDETMTNQPKLYKTKEGDNYGTFLTSDSTGKLVLEMKGSGDVKAFGLAEVEEVLPWTYSVKLTNGNTGTYTGPKDCVKVGDVLFADNCFGSVTKVNTKQRAHIGPWTGVKLVTEKLDAI